jgi:hypothetical protein
LRWIRYLVSARRGIGGEYGVSIVHVPPPVPMQGRRPDPNLAGAAINAHINPCRNRFSASSRLGCGHTLQERLTSMAPLAPPARLIAPGTAKSARNVHCEELAVRWLAILPQLLSALDEHA